MKKRQSANPNRVTLYMNDERRSRIEEAAIKLHAEGADDIYKPDGTINISGVVTALVKNYLTPTD